MIFKARYAAVLLAAVMAAAGCGLKKVQNAVDNTPVLVLGSDEYEPYVYTENGEDYIGIDVDLAKEACKRIGYRAAVKIIKWDEKDKSLESGEVDCLWGSFSMNGRENSYKWAGPYLLSRQVVAVHKNSSLYTLKDLADKYISVQSSSKPESIFLNPDNERIPAVKNVYCFVELEDAFAAFRKGYVDAVAGHEIPMKKLMDDDDGNYRILDEPLIVSKLGAAFKKDDTTGLPERLKEAFIEMINDGTLETIIAKYGIGKEDIPTEDLYE